MKKAMLSLNVCVLCALAAWGADSKSEAEAKRLEGRALIRAGQPEAASAAYRRSIELNPENAEAYVGLATVLDAQNHSLMERGKGVQTNLLQELIARSKRALELDPQQLKARELLGNAYMDLGRFDGAIREHEAVLKLCPTNADAMVNLGAALEGAGQSPGALDLFHKAAVLRPNLMLVYRNIGFYHYKRNQWRQAIDAYLTARALDEFVSGGNEGMTVTSAAGFKDLERDAQQKPQEPWTHYYLAYACLYTGKESRAFKEIDKAIKLAPEEAEFYAAKAQMCQNRGKSKEALAPGKQCLTRNPTNWICCFYLGHAYFSIGDLATACQLFEQGIRANPGAPSLHAGLGAARSLQGDDAAAVGQLEQALALLEAQGVYCEPFYECNLAVGHMHLKHRDQARYWALLAQRHGLKEPKLQRILNWADRPEKGPTS